MSKDAFWALIQEAKTACGQDLNAMEDYLREQLVSMGPAAAKNFHDILQTYEDLADQYGLWDAVSVIKEYGCSDDGFIDFRAWLIAQGKEVYMNALRDPDTLADIFNSLMVHCFLSVLINSHKLSTILSHERALQIKGHV